VKEKYKGNDNYGKPKSDYLVILEDLTLKQLEETTEQMIWLSAYANNNSRSDYHWQVDACYDECEKREPGMYARIHKEVSKAYR
jgi:hypothetical protein